MASGRPILCIGPEDGDAAHILEETHTGQTVSFSNKEKIKLVLKGFYKEYLESGLPSNENKEIEKYSREALTEKYVNLLSALA